MKPTSAVEKFAEGCDDGGHPQAQAVDPAHQAEVQGGVDQRALVLEPGHEVVLSGLGLGRQFGVHGGGEPVALVGLEPFGVPRAVRHEDGRQEAQEDRRDAFDDVEPLPALEAHDAVHLQEEPGYRGAERVGDGLGEDEDAQHGHALRGGEPQRQVEQDRREESGLGGAQQEPDDVVGAFAVDQAHGGGEDAPRDQDAGQPLPGSEPVHARVAGNLEEGVAEEEDAGAKAVGSSVQANVLAHGELGESDVVAVQVGNEVEQDNQGHDAAADLAERAVTQFAESGGLGG